jgi:hypothetical protein
MPTLIETYARSTGLKIDKPWIKEDFFPLPFTKYITLSAGSGQGAKNYDFYHEVLQFLSPILLKYGIQVVLLGSKDDPIIQGTFDMRGRTSISQSYYILKRALVHLGNDSWAAHAAGWSGVPLVALYGSTDSNIHGPYWKGETRLISSHRFGRKPSFSAHESPKTINLIRPEVVVNSVLELLNVPERFNQTSLYIGPYYSNTVLEWIPNCAIDANYNPDVPLTARMDLHHDEQQLLNVLQSGRKVNIVTKEPINIQILDSFKNSIMTYNHEISENCPPQYIKRIKIIIPKSIFFSRLKLEDELSALRFKFFDICNIEQAIDRKKEDFLRESKEYINNTVDIEYNFDKMLFRTNKYVLSNSKIYFSNAHAERDIVVGAQGSNSVIDNDVFWKELNHHYIYF